MQYMHLLSDLRTNYSFPFKVFARETKQLFMREKVWFFLHICQSHPLGPGNGGSVGVIAGVGGGVAALLLGVVLYIMFYRRKRLPCFHFLKILPYMVMILWASLYVNYHARSYFFYIFCRKAFISLIVLL